MFSATKLLGGVMENGLGGGGMLGTAAKVAGVAAVGGVAYGAYRHYKAGGFGQGGPGLFGGANGPPGGAPGAPPAQGQPFAGAQPGGGNPFGGGSAAAPTGGGSPFAGSGPPPGGNPWAAPGGPPQGAEQAPTAGAPPAPPAPPTDAEESQAMILVRAMIAAAYVDGRLDDSERASVMKAAANAGMGDAEKSALERELQNPHKPNELFGGVTDHALKKQIYLVTLLAIDRDNATEQAYVAGLPLYLGLTPADVGAIHQQMGF